MLTADDWIQKLNLKKHPEGGYFREYYRSEESIAQTALPQRYNGARCFSTAIYFLLKNDDISHLHRLKSDEIWHFHMGTAVNVHCFFPDNRYQHIILGPDPNQGHQLHVVLPAGTRFGAQLVDQAGYILMGCTVAPGFDFADFELCQRDVLLNDFPDQEDVIKRLTNANN